MIAYLTHDEVNAEVARKLACQLESDLTVLFIKEMDKFVSTDLLLIDLDHLPPECRTTLFRHASRGKLPAGLAVHSYHLSCTEARSLRTAGVVAARRLSTELLAALITPIKATIPQEILAGETQTAPL